jgi:hypothetical protein
MRNRSWLLLAIVFVLALVVAFGVVGCKDKKAEEKKAAQLVVDEARTDFENGSDGVFSSTKERVDFLKDRDELKFQREILNPLKKALAENRGPSLKERNRAYRKVADALTALDKKLGTNQVRKNAKYEEISIGIIMATNWAEEARWKYNKAVETYNLLVSEAEKIPLLE